MVRGLACVASPQPRPGREASRKASGWSLRRALNCSDGGAASQGSPSSSLSTLAPSSAGRSASLAPSGPRSSEGSLGCPDAFDLSPSYLLELCPDAPLQRREEEAGPGEDDLIPGTARQAAEEVVASEAPDLPEAVLARFRQSLGGVDDSCSEAVLGNRYRVDLEDSGLLGVGRHSLTRSGTDIHSGQRVAVKIFLTDERSVLDGRYQRSVAALGLLKSGTSDVGAADLLCEVLDHRVEAGIGRFAYMVTPLGEGSLQDYLDGRLRVDLDPSELMQRVLAIVSALHTLDVVHLDLSPSKFVFFSGRLKLVGLGGCLRPGVEVHPGSYVPLYSSPELREAVDAREKLRADRSLDAWSVGVVLCQLLLCGRLRAEEFCHAGSQPGWHEHFFTKAESSSPHSDTVALIHAALCNTEPHLRFDCHDLLQSSPIDATCCN